MSSSSGEEVEVEVENHVEGAGHGKGFNWHGEDIRNLARQIVSKISPDESIAPFDSIDINWTDIGEALGLEGELCRRKWSALCNSVRTYRTLPEIAVDILSQNSKLEIQKLNKCARQKASSSSSTTDKVQEHTAPKRKKKSVNPDHPKRPKVNGYSYFCGEMTKELVSSGIKGVPLMLKLSTMWKELSEKERAKYNLKCAKQKEAYVKEVMQYSQAHPDDMEIKKILEDETHRKAKVSTSKKTTKTKEELESSELDDTMNTTMNDTVRSSTPLKTPKKKKRQHDDDSQDSSPTKNKKMKVKKVWTAEEMHFESKYADYKAEHPDLEDDVVRRKIASKFKRLSEEKIAKYKRKAEQRNDESD